MVLRKLDFKCLFSRSVITVMKSYHTRDYSLFNGDKAIGRFKKAGNIWFLYDGYVVRKFDRLSDLMVYVGEIS